MAPAPQLRSWNHRMVFFVIFLLCSEWLGATANMCELGQVPDPSHPGKLRWATPTGKRADRCACTSLAPGGLVVAPNGSRQPHYVDRPVFTTNRRKILALFDCADEFSIIGKPAVQSSTYRVRGAAKGVDGNVDTTTNGNCVHTDDPPESPPWWRVDLGGEHCIAQVNILNRGFCCSQRTTHAVVRAGPGTNVTNNPTCGSPVTAEQAAPPGGLIEMACDPPLRARYVSVELPVVAILNFCEVTVKELPLAECP